MTEHQPSERAETLRVLVVDDEPIMLQVWKKALADYDCQIKTLASGEEVVGLIEQWRPDVAVLDIRLPKVSGVDLLRDIKTRDLDTEVVMMTAFATVETAVEAVKRGAYDFLTKPFNNIEAAALTVIKAGRHRRLLLRNRQLENLIEVRDSFEGLVGTSPPMRQVFEVIEAVAYSTSTVLVQGESGTGKELVARAIHHRSPRKERPFVAINCSALPDSLLESELFGHEKGSFTGATGTKRGLFEMADGGTILLDEIGDLPAQTQVKLLRVLQEGEVRRVGSNETRKVDVRVIAATNIDLAKARRDGSFREDLYYRLKVIAIEMPPLRDRADDIHILAMHFLRKYNQRNGKNISGFNPEALDLLLRYNWPGNVRELENAVERAVVLNRKDEIQIGDLPAEMHSAGTVRSAVGSVMSEMPYNKARTVAMREFESAYIQEILSQTAGNVSKAARKAGMDRSNFRRVMKKVGIDAKRFSGNGDGRRTTGGSQ